MRVRKINGSLQLVDSHLGWNPIFLDTVPLLAFHERAGVKMERKQMLRYGGSGERKGVKKNIEIASMKERSLVQCAGVEGRI